MRSKADLGRKTPAYRLRILIRQIEIGLTAWSIRPSFIMPYMTITAKDVEKVLFMWKFAVPFWAIARSHEHDHIITLH